jgi:hypothetical protein
LFPTNAWATPIFRELEISAARTVPASIEEIIQRFDASAESIEEIVGCSIRGRTPKASKARTADAEIFHKTGYPHRVTPSSAGGNGAYSARRPEHHGHPAAAAPRAAKSLGQPPQWKSPAPRADQGLKVELAPEIAVATVL